MSSNCGDSIIFAMGCNGKNERKTIVGFPQKPKWKQVVHICLHFLILILAGDKKKKNHKTHRENISRRMISIKLLHGQYLSPSLEDKI